MSEPKDNSGNVRLNDKLGDPFEVWLRQTCFQKPTPEAYDLARSAWNAALEHAHRHIQNAALAYGWDTSSDGRRCDEIVQDLMIA